MNRCPICNEPVTISRSGVVRRHGGSPPCLASLKTPAEAEQIHLLRKSASDAWWEAEQRYDTLLRSETATHEDIRDAMLESDRLYEAYLQSQDPIFHERTDNP